MLLSALLLNDVSDVNHFSVVQTLEMVQGDTQPIYLVLTDASVNQHSDPPGRRYCAPANSTLRVTLQDIDSSVTITKGATRPFAGDQSVWLVALDPVQDAATLAGLRGTYALKLALTEPGIPSPMPAAWVVGTTYSLGALVTYGGNLYRSLQVANTGNQPDQAALWWAQMNVVRARTLSGFVPQALSISRQAQEF